MLSLKTAYINELYKISKKKKMVISAILSTVLAVVMGIIVYSLKNFMGINLTGSSEFSIMVLSMLNYTLIPLFTAFVCIDMFSSEYVDQTIKLTLTRPVSRLKIYLSKALAAATFILINLIFVMIISVIISLIIKGASISIIKIILAYLVSFFPLLTLSLFIIFICHITKGTASAFLLSILAFIVFNVLGIVFNNYESFFFTSYLDWYNLFLGSYINFSKIFRVALILLGYEIMLFGIGYYLFEKKDI